MANTEKEARDTREVLGLYSNDCLKCSHLVEGGKKAFAKCHHSKGNTYCPAQEVKIVIVGQAKKLATRVIKARDKRDLTAEARLLNSVASKSKEFQSKFYDILESSNGA